MVCMCIFRRLHMRLRVQARVPSSVRAHILAHTYVSSGVRTCTCGCGRVHARFRICAHAKLGAGSRNSGWVHTFSVVHTRTFTHMHTRLRMHARFWTSVHIVRHTDASSGARSCIYGKAHVFQCVDMISAMHTHLGLRAHASLGARMCLWPCTRKYADASTNVFGCMHACSVMRMRTFRRLQRRHHVRAVMSSDARTPIVRCVHVSLGAHTCRRVRARVFGCAHTLLQMQ